MSCGNVYSYSAGEVSLVISGTQIAGFDTIQVVTNPELYYMVKGMNGQHTRVRSYDTAATIQITLPQTSFSNDVLSTFLQNDYRRPTGALEIQVKDNSGRYLFNSVSGFIRGYADATFEEDITTRVWVVDCLQSTVYLGSSASQNIFDKGIAVVDKVQNKVDKVKRVVDFIGRFTN